LDHHRSAHRGLDNVQIGKRKANEAFRDMAVLCCAVGVGHRVECAAWRYTYRHMIPRPGGNHGVDDLKEETGSVLNRSALLVSSLISAIMQKLVEVLVVSRFNLD